LKSYRGLKTVIRLSSEHLDDSTQIKNASLPIASDLDGVALVDIEVVRYLNACAAKNVGLPHCSPDIRQWILREYDRKEKRP
jgi:hypothetical protein